MKPLLIGFILLMISCENKDPNDLQSIQLLIDEQENAWNRGDLESFMQAYLQSDSLIFVGGSGVNYGWQTTLDNYRKAYGSKEKMGTLLFENEIIKAMDENSAMAAGRWNLFRINDTLSGNYLLLWQKINGNWKIVADHSSSDQ